MTALRTMPRPTIALAALIIAGSAAAGLGLGLVSKLKSTGTGDLDSGEVVAPIKTVANATPLTSSPVTEADVRRWVHEELAARPTAPPAPRKQKAEPDGDTSGDAAAAPTVAPGAPATPAAPATTVPKNQTAQQIPF